MLKNYLQGGLDMSRWIQDAGHGGSDPGAVCYGQAEKDWALEAALYVNKRLKELRISSSITRNTDVSLSRQERTSKVKNTTNVFPIILMLAVELELNSFIVFMLMVDLKNCCLMSSIRLGIG